MKSQQTIVSPDTEEFTAEIFKKLSSQLACLSCQRKFSSILTFTKPASEASTSKSISANLSDLSWKPCRRRQNPLVCDDEAEMWHENSSPSSFSLFFLSEAEENYENFILCLPSNLIRNPFPLSHVATYIFHFLKILFISCRSSLPPPSQPQPAVLSQMSLRLENFSLGKRRQVFRWGEVFCNQIGN